ELRRSVHRRLADRLPPELEVDLVHRPLAEDVGARDLDIVLRPGGVHRLRWKRELAYTGRIVGQAVEAIPDRQRVAARELRVRARVDQERTVRVRYGLPDRAQVQRGIETDGRHG